MTWLLTDQTVINNGVVLRGAPTTTEIEPLTFYATIDVAVYEHRYIIVESM